ncbi:MAG TPA: outer membrane beta-barrel protein [Gammaproteobacteria bacterium]|nr:outer membrane beta-barrel protein [Gammaproteobacteria bacterium]
MLKLLGVIALCFWAVAVQAQEAGGPYVGVSIGDFGYDQGDDGPFGVPYSSSRGAYRLFGGYQLDNVYAIEVGWEKTNDLTGEALGFSPTLGPELAVMSANYEISSIRLMAFAPFSSVRMFGAIGYYDAKLDVSAQFETSTDVVFKGEDKLSGNGGMVIGGVQYDMKRFSIRGEYEWLHTKNLPSAQSINVGVLFMF